jgi:glycosyltransferase involved in cell wall biosynthesis
MWLLGPFVLLLALGLVVLRRRSWSQSRTSAYNWLQGQLMDRFIGPDRRATLTRLLLAWWRLRWRFDLLHIHGYTNTLLFVVEWAHARGVPVVYEEHQTPDAQFDWWEGFQHSINKASRIVAVSEKSAGALQDVCGVTQPIVVAYPMMADPMAAGWRRNGKPRNGDEPVYVTTVARLWVTKGLTYLVEAIAQIQATHPSTQFRVYGDGELRQDLLDHADRLGLDGDAIFVGAFTDREELSHIMDQTDIFAMSSILEGQPLAVVEAMSYGCPIVATNVGGIPEMIQDGVNGLLCEPSDPECLAQKIRILIEDPALRQRLGQAARKSYEQGPYQPAAVANHFISVYQDVLQQQDREAVS